MRHIRTRRRFKFILTLLLALCIVLFFESKIEAFVPQLKVLAESEIEKSLGGRINLSIGSVDGGIMHPFVLNDVVIRDKKNTVLFPSLVIDNIKTEYRLWDLFFKTRNGSSIANILPHDSHIYINFTTKNRDIAGFLCFQGNLEESRVKGFLNLYRRRRMDFYGTIRGNSLDIDIRSRGGTLRAEGTISDDGTLVMNLKANHLRFRDIDIVCDGTLTTKIHVAPDNPKRRSLVGEFETKNIILNYKPFLNIRTSYRYDVLNAAIELPNLEIGDSFRVRGRFIFRRPYKLDVTTTANNVSIAWLLSSLGVKDPASVLSGTLNGKFGLKGRMKNPKIAVVMEVKKGTISRLDFENLTATLKGEFPFIRIEESRITRESGYFSLAGEMDLRHTGMAALFKDIKIVTDEKAITWDEWDARKLKDVQEVRMKKKLNEEVSIDFKQYIKKDAIDESTRDKDEVQLEYKLHPHDSLKMVVGRDEDFLGLEHKDKF